MVILDTSAIISLLNETDSNHDAAVSKFNFYAEEREIFIIDKLVIVELITVAKSRFKQQSIEKIFAFVKLLMEKELASYLYVEHDKSEFNRVLELAEEADSAKLSFVDLMLFVLSKRYLNADILTFDKKLKDYSLKNK